jgi:hypothetical protein
VFNVPPDKWRRGNAGEWGRKEKSDESDANV